MTLAEESGRILVVGPAWVGDMVMAQSLFMTLRQRNRVVAVDVLAPPWSLPLLSRMPEVAQGIALEVSHGQLGLATRWRTGRSLKGRYRQAIVLPRSLKSALVPFFASAAQRTGYRGEMRHGLLNDIRTLDKGVLTQTVQRYVALGWPVDAPQPPPVPQPRLRVDEANRTRLLKKFALEPQVAVGLFPGAEYGPAKQWPAEHYAVLARELIAQGTPVWIFGSSKERPLAETIARTAGGGPVNLCGQTTLEEAIDLISACRAVVSNDSGLMHVAAALEVPLVAIYGSSTPEYTPPLSGLARTLYTGIGCSPCFKRSCLFRHTRCLSEILPAKVLDAVDSVSNAHC